MVVSETSCRTPRNGIVRSEAELRKYLIANVGDLGCWSPIEAHVSQPGIPDYSYTINGTNGWLELKFGTAAKTPHLRVMQKIWLERNTKHGGNPLVLVGAVIDDHLEFGIAHGNKAGKMTAAKTNKDWMACCTTVWLDRVVWSEFLAILCNPWSQA